MVMETASNHRIEVCDFLVIGSGLAGLAFALKVAPFGKVVVISKAQAPATNTSMAQGGIAAVMGDDDSFESHIRDTLVAGAGLCKESAVRLVVESAPSVIRELLGWGVKFDVTGPEGKIDLTREGGHSAPSTTSSASALSWVLLGGPFSSAAISSGFTKRPLDQ